MKTTQHIKINDYVSNDKVATSIFTDSSTNKYIIKGSTGIGGTSAVFTITNESRILISPLSGMIVSKELKRNENHMFIYAGSLDNWTDWDKRTRDGEHIILNTTPEQIIIKKKDNPEMYARIIQVPFVIDEWDMFVTSEYRLSLKAFFNIVFTELEKPFIITTATPIHNHLELPNEFKNTIDIYHISRENEPLKPITIVPLNNYFNFIIEECGKGNKVVIFTNDIKKIKNIKNNPELPYVVQELVGEMLDTKLSAVYTKTLYEHGMAKKGIIDVDADIYILSTKYLIGFDIEFDASIGIFSDESSKIDSNTINEIRQAYGRVRSKVNTAQLFYRTIPIDNSRPIIPIGHLEFLASQVEFKDNDEYLTQKNEYIAQINNQLTYNRTNLIDELSKAGFDVSEESEVFNVERMRLPFNVKYRNLANANDYIAASDLLVVCDHIKGDNVEYNGFGKESLLLYSVGYLASISGNRFLMNLNPQRYSQLLDSAKIFIDCNRVEDNQYSKISKNTITPTQRKFGIDNGAIYDKYFEMNLKHSRNDMFQKAILIIEHLYQMHLLEDIVNLDQNTISVIRGFEIASQCVIADFNKAISKYEGSTIAEILGRNNKAELDSVNKTIGDLTINTVFKNTNRDIVDRLQDVDGIDEKIFTQIMKKSDDIKSSLLKNKNGLRASISSNTYSIARQLEVARTYVLSLLSLQISNHMFGFKVTTKDNRDFNTVTKCTRQLRKFTPFVMYEADIQSAFASFIDSMVGSTIAPLVYKNIMVSYKVERDEAKVLYNSALNDATRSKVELTKFFTNCGYTASQVSEIVKLVTVEKGAFYRSMTLLEEGIIKRFKYVNDIGQDAIRCHDAIYWPATNNDKTIITLVDGINFDFKKI